MRKALFALAVAAVIIVAFIYHKRLFLDDEKRIREIIAEIEKAAEAKDLPGVMKHISGDYSDESGLNKFYLRRLLQGNLKKVDELRVKVEEVNVFVTGEKAYVNLAVTAEATRKGRIFFPLGSQDEPEHPKITFQKTGTGDWEIIKIENVDTGPGLGF